MDCVGRWTVAWNDNYGKHFAVKVSPGPWPHASLPGMSGCFVVRQRQRGRTRPGWLVQPARKDFARCNMSNCNISHEAKLGFLPGKRGRGAAIRTEDSTNFKTLALAGEADKGRQGTEAQPSDF